MQVVGSVHVASFHVCPFAEPDVIPHIMQVAGSVHVASFHVCPLAQVVLFTLSLSFELLSALVLVGELYSVSELLSPFSFMSEEVSVPSAYVVNPANNFSIALWSLAIHWICTK